MKHKILLLIPLSLLLPLISTCDLTSSIQVPESEKIDTNIRRTYEIEFPCQQDLRCEGECINCSETTGTSLHVSMDPDDRAIWPGALIGGAEIMTGSNKPIIVPRNNVWITVDYAGGSLNAFTINLSAGNEFENSRTLLSRVRTVNIEYSDKKMFGKVEIKNVFSEEQLKILLKCYLSVDTTPLGKIFDFSTSKYRKVIKIYNVYYEARLAEHPSNPSQFFNLSMMKWEDLDSKIGRIQRGNGEVKICPLYLATVSYGTMGLFFIEADHLYQTEGFTRLISRLVDGNSDTTLDRNLYTENVQSCSIKGLTYTDSNTALINPSYQSLDDSIQSLKSVKGSCSPIHYSFKYLKDEPYMNPVTVYIRAENYDMNTCNAYTINVHSVNEDESEVDADHLIDIAQLPENLVLTTAESYMSSYNVEHVFSHWEITDAANVSFTDPYSSTITLSDFRGNCRVMAVYDAVSTPDPTATSTPDAGTPTITPTPTPTGTEEIPPEPTYTFTIVSYDSTGERGSQSLTVTYSSSIPITTTDTYSTSDSIGPVWHEFRYWLMSNGADADLVNGNLRDATVRGFLADVTVTAMYAISPPYTVSVTRIPPGCTYPDSLVSITSDFTASGNELTLPATISQCKTGEDLEGDIYLNFTGWHIDSGSGEIASNPWRIINLTGNSRVSAMYSTSR